MALLTTSISVESIWHKHVFWQMCWYIISTIPYYTFGSFDGKCRAWVPAAFIHPCHGQRVCPHKERQRVEILQKQKKPWRPWSLKRWRWRLQREMGIASQPFRRKKQSGWKSARQQLCNHWRLRCKGAMWRNVTGEPRQLLATFLCECKDLEHVMSLTQFRKRLKTSIAAKNLQLWPEMQCEILWILWWFPVSDLHLLLMRISSWDFQLLVFYFSTSNSFHIDFTDKLQRWRKWLVEVSQHLEVQTRDSPERQLRQHRQMQSSKGEDS